MRAGRGRCAGEWARMELTHEHKQTHTGAYKYAAARDGRLLGSGKCGKEIKNSEQNHVTTINALIGYYIRTDIHIRTREPLLYIPQHSIKPPFPALVIEEEGETSR